MVIQSWISLPRFEGSSSPMYACWHFRGNPAAYSMMLWWFGWVRGNKWFHKRLDCWLVGLCCLMTSGLSKDIRCHVWPYFLYTSANQQIRHQATHKVGCQPGDFAYDHFNIPPGFVWVYMSCFKIIPLLLNRCNWKPVRRHFLPHALPICLNVQISGILWLFGQLRTCI